MPPQQPIANACVPIARRRSIWRREFPSASSPALVRRSHVQFLAIPRKQPGRIIGLTESSLASVVHQISNSVCVLRLDLRRLLHFLKRRHLQMQITRPLAIRNQPRPAAPPPPPPPLRIAVVEEVGEHRERELVSDAVGRVAKHPQRLARPGVLCGSSAAGDRRLQRRIDSAASASSSRVASITAISSSCDNRCSRRSRSA